MELDRLQPPTRFERSESELSDLNDIPTTTIPSVHRQRNGDISDDDAMHGMATSEVDGDDDEDAPGEEDEDFDEDTPPPADISGMSHDRSSEESSPRPGKRKADVDDEDYIKQNPELYGLRRSVRFTALAQGACC